MCVGIPGKVIALKNNQAQIKQGKHKHWVSTALVGNLRVGHYVLTYQDAIINKISSGQAKEIIQMVSQP